MKSLAIADSIHGALACTLSSLVATIVYDRALKWAYHDLGIGDTLKESIWDETGIDGGRLQPNADLQ
jgi:hypothetical protein